jgi:hypothetical protein
MQLMNVVNIIFVIFMATQKTPWVGFQRGEDPAIPSHFMDLAREFIAQQKFKACALSPSVEPQTSHQAAHSLRRELNPFVPTEQERINQFSDFKNKHFGSVLVDKS